MIIEILAYKLEKTDFRKKLIVQNTYRRPKYVTMCGLQQKQRFGIFNVLGIKTRVFSE